MKGRKPIGDKAMEPNERNQRSRSSRKDSGYSRVETWLSDQVPRELFKSIVEELNKEYPPIDPLDSDPMLDTTPRKTT